MHTDDEKRVRRGTVAAAKDALARSSALSATNVVQPRAALLDCPANLNQLPQPSDGAFQALIDAPFREPPRRRRP